jgi:uncharacterized protein (DUF736 family)
MDHNRTITLGQFVRDELGTLHGRLSGLGIGSTSVISEETRSDHLKLIADPLGAAYEVGVAMPKETDGKHYYTAVLDSPIFQAPLDVLILPDEEVPHTFNILWNRGAAPELFEALELVFEDWLTLVDVDLNEENPDCLAIEAKVRAAIAAASAPQ